MRVPFVPPLFSFTTLCHFAKRGLDCLLTPPSTFPSFFLLDGGVYLLLSYLVCVLVLYPWPLCGMMIHGFMVVWYVL